MKRKNSTRASGFSLVELLVVITIIVVLATLSFSIVGQMMGRAKIANATNCMRNNGLALHQYIADNNQTFPGPLIWYQGVGLKGTLFNFLAPYMGTEKLPANEKDIFATAAYSSYVPEYLRKSAAGNLSYGYFAVNTQGYLDRGDGVNQSVWGYGPNRDASGNIERPRKLTELLAISRLTAKGRGTFDPETRLALLKTLAPSEQRAPMTPTDHLKGKVVYLYLDGHTEVKPVPAPNKAPAGDF